MSLIVENILKQSDITNGSMKFRKVIDVKREKELDERRKNEKLTLSADHPVRKLLFRMRERHGTRIFPSPLFADIERGIKKLEMNRHSSSVSLTTDEALGNHIVRGTKEHLGAPRKPPLVKRATVGEEDILHKTAWVASDSKKDLSRLSNEISTMLTEMKATFEVLNERMQGIEQMSTRLLSVEKLLMTLHRSQTVDCQTSSGSSNMPPQHTTYARPSTCSPCVPPLRQLDVESAWEETMVPNVVPSIHIDSDSVRNSAPSPPERKRI
ncbi:unnamed protein product [Toxocara canis]|uniref:Potassium voltage-gated channel subfamily H member 2 n=1 Tax=Toxocara canis TaxID=6265 RepID=A0A183UWV5_TOXCA|nr:unnamed protein product [Toxocara canis]